MLIMSNQSSFFIGCKGNGLFINYEGVGRWKKGFDFDEFIKVKHDPKAQENLKSPTGGKKGLTTLSKSNTFAWTGRKARG